MGLGIIYWVGQVVLSELSASVKMVEILTPCLLRKNVLTLGTSELFLMKLNVGWLVTV